jgi:predicted N-acetyltransferase YhbS
MPELMRYASTDTIRLHLEARIRALLHAEWPGNEATEATQPLLASEFHPMHFVLADAEEVLGYARTIWMEVPYLEQNLKLYGLGDVVIKPKFRNQRYGTRIVEAATVFIQSDQEADAAVLLTEPNLEAFYRRCGWRHFTRPQIVISESGGCAAEANFPMMLLLSTRAHAALNKLQDEPLVLTGDEW